MSVNIAQLIGAVGGLSGLVSLAWQFRKTFASYLSLEVRAASGPDCGITVFTSVTNAASEAKGIRYSVLIIGPEAEQGCEVAQKHDPEIKKGRDIWKLQKTIDDQRPRHIDMAIAIPLPFYYSENFGVGDEKLTYRCTVPAAWLPPGAYSVRFYVFPKSRSFLPASRKLHRCTQDLFVIPEPTRKVDAA